MNSIQRKRLQCKLLLLMDRHPKYAKQIGLVDKSHFQTKQKTHKREDT